MRGRKRKGHPEYINLRSEGKTYKEIAEICGCSYQNVARFLGPTDTGFNFKPYDKKSCIYDGLRNWANENKMSRTQIRRIMSGDDELRMHNSGNDVLYSRMCGLTQFKKNEIDNLLEKSGMTYEEMFREG